jgi:hypothetical protein
MSNLLVQNIKHTNNTTSMAIDTSGQVTIRGEGSATTTNLQQGLAKHWVSFEGRSTVSIHDSFNNASLTDNGTGDYTLAFTNSMRAAAAYSMAGSTYDNGDTNLGGIMSDTPNASSIQISVAVGTSFVDRAYDMIQIVGDLA